MADQFHTGVCGESWWNSSKPTFGSSPCSSLINDIGGFVWPTDLYDIKSRSSDDIQKPHQPDSVGGGGGNISNVATLQIMGLGLSSSTTTDWNQALVGGSGRGEDNYQPMLQEDLNSSLNYGQETENQDFSLDQQPVNPITNSGEFNATCEGLATSFPMSSSSYFYPSTSTLMQTLFDSDSPPQQSLFNNPSMNFCPSTTNLNEFSPSLPKFSSLMKPSLPKQQPAPFWNASTAALNDIRASFFPSSQSQFLSSTFEEKPNSPKVISKSNNEEIRDSSTMMKKSSSEPVFKRPRIETPSPLPTFKVRKEKLGDRITALQQLVSPFGKTDTASVLHEAIDYIRILHDKVNALSTPYMKNGSLIQRQQTPDKLNETEEPRQDLRSRGLCLVPISSTFPVAAETTADFWTPTFGATFR